MIPQPMQGNLVSLHRSRQQTAWLAGGDMLHRQLLSISQYLQYPATIKYSLTVHSVEVARALPGFTALHGAVSHACPFGAGSHPAFHAPLVRGTPTFPQNFGASLPGKTLTSGISGGAFLP